MSSWLGARSAIHARGRLAARAQVVGEIVRQVALSNRPRGPLDVVFHAHEFHVHSGPRANMEQDIAGAPIAILRTTDAARIDEVNALHDAVPWLVRVTEANDVARPRAYGAAHLLEKRVGSLLMDVHCVERLIPVQQRHCGPGDVSAERSQGDLKWKTTEKSLRLRGDVRARPLVREMRQLLLPSVFVLAATMLVVHRDSRIVIPGDAGDSFGFEPRDDLVRPRRIAD